MVTAQTTGATGATGTIELGSGGKSARRTLLGAGLALGGVLAAACSAGGGSSGGALPPKQLKSGLTVTWFSHIQNVPLGDEVNASWAQKHPNIKIAYDFHPEGLTKLVTAMAAGTPPEVAMLVYGNVPKVQPQMRDLTPYMKRDHFADKEFFPPALEQYRYKGSSFAMPYDFPIRCIWYNAAMFRERGVPAPAAGWDDAGWSWNDFADAARRLTRPDQAPAEAVWGVRWGVDLPAVFETHYFLLNNGASFLNADGTQCVVNEPAGVEALQFMQDLLQRWRVARLPADVQAAGGDRFAAGKLAMDVFRPVQIANYRRDLTFDWALAPLPRGPHGKGRTTIMGGSAWVLPQGNQNPEEAWELVQHLTTPEVERGQIKYVGIMPARRQVMDEFAGQEPPKNMKLVLRGAESCQLLPKSPWWAEVQTVAKPLLDELWAGSRNPSSAAQEIKRVVDEQLKQPFTFKTN